MNLSTRTVRAVRVITSAALVGTALVAVSTPQAAQAHPGSVAAKAPLPAAASAVSPGGDAGGRGRVGTAGSHGVTRTTATTVAPLGRPVTTPITPHEIVGLRTATSDTRVNRNGTLTTRVYPGSHYYKVSGALRPIDTTLVADASPADRSGPAGRARASAVPMFSTRANAWRAIFAPTGYAGGMLRIEQGGTTVAFRPVGAAPVDPVLSRGAGGVQTITYANVRPGTSLVYSLTADAVKESIVLADAHATPSLSFAISGADLVPASGKDAPAFRITGALGGQFSITRANLMLNKFGPARTGSALRQTYTHGVLTVAIDPGFLAGLPAAAFPAAIDPGVDRSAFGNRGGGNFVSFETNGYTCYSNVCNLYAGSLFDVNYHLQYWRGAFFSPYDRFRNPAFRLTHANLHLQQRSNESFWTGTPGGHTYYVAHAACNNGFNCLENGWNAAAYFDSVGDVDVTGIYQTMIARGDFGAWLMVGSEDGTTSSFRNFDPNNSFVDFTYVDQPAAPTFQSPQDNQVYVDPQASIRLDGVGNPNNGTPLQYEIVVSSAPAGTGTVIDSGLLTSTQWTVPDGVLQDGSSYSVRARSYDPVNQYYSNWGASVSFRIDSRTGNDPTQSLDSVGGIGVDLATGNVTASAASHTTASLSGDIGVSLQYSSPLKSRSGLVGQYWNVPAGYSGGAPTSAPTLTRVDQDVDFNWGADSPQNGLVSADWFYGKWAGYFVAPTNGSFSFGGSNDDMMSVTVAGSVVYSTSICGGPCYGSAVNLTAGQVVPITVLYEEYGGAAMARLWVKGAVPQQIVPSAWLQTGVRPVAQEQGLVGHYYTDPGSHDLDAAAKTQFLGRTDALVSFNWGAGSPIPNGPTDSFMVRWTGYVTVPATGSYYFGAAGDDGTRITVNGTKVEQNWGDALPLQYGSAVTLTGGVPVPIVVDYYEAYGGASIGLYVKGAVAEEIVPSSWLSPQAQVLPTGWQLGIDADGSLTYTHLVANQNNVVLTDSFGTTHEYTWKGSGYAPPTGEDGQLVRNADGSFTLQDVDGRTYVFGTDGVLTSVTDPVDDLHPAALRYTYAGNPAHLVRITDGVAPGRYADLAYSGDARCPTPPAAFDAVPPSGMLCAVITNDGRSTGFFYESKQLARIVAPGGITTDYKYQVVTSPDSTVLGYRLAGVRGDLAYEAIRAGVRTGSSDTLTELRYDALGRAARVTLPAAGAGAVRQAHTYSYGVGMTRVHEVGASEPHGYTRRVRYDSLDRTTQDSDVTGKSTTFVWDAQKDLRYSVTDAAGQTTSTIYDDEDRPVGSYGPAPQDWFTSSTDSFGHQVVMPLAADVSRVPHVSTRYDQGIVGAEVAWFDYSKQAGDQAGSLIGSPRLHTTGLTPANPGMMSADFGSAPIAADDGMQGVGFSATGKLRLPPGTYTITADAADGVRVWVNDQVVLDSWTDAAYGGRTGTAFQVSDARPDRFRVDAYRRTGSGGGFDLKLAQSGGFGATSDWSQWLTPDYSLTTSTTVDDAAMGDVTDTVDYGARPELGLPQAQTAKGSGLALTTNSTYEAGQLLRKTGTTEPGGGGSVGYAYYGATDTADNLCTTGTEAYQQGGMLQTKTMLDPDGTGPQTGQAVTTVYDDAGRPVATRANDDPWTCTTYDAAGRAVTSTTPSINGRPGRTVTYDYAIGKNPLVRSVTDSQTGTETTTVDLLGRTVAYTDTYGYTTHEEYDATGHPISMTSPVGAEAVTYDAYGRPATYSLDGSVYAQIAYDADSRIASVDYPQAGDAANQLRLSAISYDASAQPIKATFTMSDGTSFVESVKRDPQSGIVTGDTESLGGKSASSSYQFDGLGRLAKATVDNWVFAYGFGAEPASCAPGTNPAAGDDGNRTSYTVTDRAAHTTQSFANCYNFADQLVSTSDPQLGAPVYDDHGNTVRLDGGGTPITLTYNASDQNTAIEQGTSRVEYDRDQSGVVVAKREYEGGSLVASYRYSGNAVFSCDLTDQTQCALAESDISLAGGVKLTLAGAAGGTRTPVYSVQNFHGDTAFTVDASGAATSSVHLYDPFGQAVNSATFGTSGNPANGLDGGLGWATSAGVRAETQFSTPIVQLGARVYLPTAGRFAQVDPVQGGTPNAYTYVLDPVNYADYSGQWGFHLPHWVKTVVKAVAIAVVVIGVVLLAVAALPEEVVGGIVAAGAAIVNAVSRAAPTITRVASGISKGLRSGAVQDTENEMPRASVTELRPPAVLESEGGPQITEPYSRPPGATTMAQRAAVQGRACVDCGAITDHQVADHIYPLVQEYYETGSIDLERMHSLDAVQPQCPLCSAQQGAAMSRYSQAMRRLLGLDE